MQRTGWMRETVTISALMAAASLAACSSRPATPPVPPPAWTLANPPLTGASAGTPMTAPTTTVASTPAAPRSPWAMDLPRTPVPAAPEPDLWQYTRWRQKKVISVGRSHLYVARLSPDDKYVLVISQIEFAIRIYELKTGRLAYKHQLPDYEILDRVDAVFWPDTSEGLRFVMAGKDGVTLRDAATGAVIERFWEELTWNVKWSPDEQILIGERSFIPDQRSELVFLVRGAGHSMRVAGRVATPHRVNNWAITADNRRFVTVNYPANQMSLRRLDTGEELWSLDSPIYASTVAISPDGAWIAAGGDHLLLVDGNDPQRQSVYRDFNNNLDTVLFSRAGEVVIASSYDGRIRILRNDVRTATLTLIQELRHGGTANVYDLGLLRDGSGMISSSGDQTVRLWGL